MANENGIQGWAENVLQNVKSVFSSSVRREEIGKYLSMDIAQGLTENSKFVVEAFEGMLEKLDYQRDFDIISEDEYYRQLEKLRDKYFSAGTQNWVKYTQKIYEYQKKTLETEKKNITSLYDEVAEYAVKRLEDVMKKQQKMASKLSSFGSLYNVNKVQIGGTTDTYYSLHDLDYDIAAIKSYGESLEEISTRAGELGVSDGAAERLLEEIKGLDTEDALGFMKALLNVGDDDFKQYSENLQIKNLLSQNIAAKQYEKEFNEGWDDAYNNMKSALLKAGYEIPDGFFTSGSISAQKFGQAFVDGLDEQLEAVRARVEEFNSSLRIDLSDKLSGNTYNTTNTSYNIQASDSTDTVEQIKRFETVKRLSGVN